MSQVDLGITFIQGRPEQAKPGMGSLPTVTPGPRADQAPAGFSLAIPSPRWLFFPVFAWKPLTVI